MKNKFDNIFYIYGGAIGGLTLAIHFLESARENLGENTNYIILVPKNTSAYDLILKKYPHIKLIEFGKRLSFQNFLFITKQFLKSNLIITAPSFGSVRLLNKLFGRFMALKKESMFVGFKNDRDSFTFLYKNIFDKPIEQTFYKTVPKILENFGMNIKRKPIIEFDTNKDIDQKFKEMGDYMIIHPYGANLKRSFPAYRWNALLTKIIDLDIEYKIIFTGSVEDTSLIKKIIDNRDGVIDLSGKTNLNELMHLINNSKLFIGVDTGITHLASLFQKDVIEIGNWSNPAWLASYSDKTTVLINRENCICNGDKTGECEYIIEGQKYFRCLFDIKDDDVLNEIKNKLSK
jgi:ADP-heptose:LPS heptosyltransferase